MGHRGCRWFPNIPENSLPSFKFAIENGAPAFELDCRLTADGHIVVFHDDAVHRLLVNADGTPAKGWVSDMTLKELQQLRYKDHSNTSETVPLLRDVLLLAKKNNTKVFVELKSLYISDAKPLAAAVAKLFNELNAHEFACIIAFNPLVVYWVRALAPRIETCILFSDDFYTYSVRNRLEKVSTVVDMLHVPMDWLLRLACIYVVPYITGCTMIGPDAKIVSQKEVKSYMERGLSVYVWVTNVQCEMDLFINLGCSAGTDKLFPTLSTSTAAQ